MRYRRASTFLDDLENLPQELQLLIKEKFALFKTDQGHNSLKIRKMRGKNDIWEGHITEGYVFTFSRERDSETNEEIITFRRVGKHSVYKKP